MGVGEAAATIGDDAVRGVFTLISRKRQDDLTQTRQVGEPSSRQTCQVWDWLVLQSSSSNRESTYVYRSDFR
ncbi:protein of unknown function [Candidatus Promineifilum breve]|uniref:Uncharacterized protein n=1 Tax=Candidatus Promineifilum breve TaxID=1806508 RepID=A0A170PJQ5_9CHLR|nr:protein of unknown function [Candidatus Promineifilum breve]